MLPTRWQWEWRVRAVISHDQTTFRQSLTQRHILNVYAASNLDFQKKEILPCDVKAMAASAWYVRDQNPWWVREKNRETISTTMTQIANCEKSYTLSDRGGRLWSSPIASTKTYWNLRRGRCETMEDKKHNISKSFILFHDKCGTVLQRKHKLRNGANHGSSMETGIMQLLQQIRMPMQGTVALRKGFTVRESWLYRMFCTPSVR